MRRKSLKRAIITKLYTIDMRPGSYNVSPFLADPLLLQCGIFNTKSGENMNKETKKDNN